MTDYDLKKEFQKLIDRIDLSDLLRTALASNEFKKIELKTAHNQDRPRLLAWLLEHNAHGLSYELFFLPEGDKPDNGEYIRAPWLDEPKHVTY